MWFDTHDSDLGNVRPCGAKVLLSSESAVTSESVAASIFIRGAQGAKGAKGCGEGIGDPCTLCTLCTLFTLVTIHLFQSVARGGPLDERFIKLAPCSFEIYPQPLRLGNAIRSSVERRVFQR